MASKRFLITMSTAEADTCRRATGPRERFATFVAAAAIKEAQFRLSKATGTFRQPMTGANQRGATNDGTRLDRSTSQE